MTIMHSMPFRERRLRAAAVIAVALSAAPGIAVAGDIATFTVEMQDGRLVPDRLNVPAGGVVKIIVRNTGTGPAEFESNSLHVEKVLAPGAESFVVLRKLSPGEYRFFDEFHPEAGDGLIIAE